MLFLKNRLYNLFYMHLPDPSGQKNHDSLRFEIHQILTRTDADVGIAVMDLFSKDTFTVHGDRHYPMQSVYKFHLALAVLNQVDRGMLKLDQLFIKKSDLLPNTYSPLRDDYPDGNISLPLVQFCSIPYPRAIIMVVISCSDLWEGRKSEFIHSIF